MNIDELTTYPYLVEIPVKLLTGNDATKQVFKNSFQNAAPEIYADIESLTLNGASCSCAKKVKEYTLANKRKVADIILSYFTSEKKSLDEYIQQLQATLTPISLSGKILKTTINKWKEFSTEISTYSFRSFSVEKEGEDLYVYFL